MASRVGVDLLVVGGGLLGMCVALKASQSGLRVLVCRLSDAEIPQADTLRNQSWLQSGLRYIGEFDDDERTVLAKGMLAGGNELYDELDLRRPAGFGIVRLRNDEEAEELEEDADRLGVEVLRLNERDVVPALRDLFAPRSVYYATPEIPFDEPMLLRRLRESVKDSGGLVWEIEEPAELVPDTSVHPSRFYATIAGQRMDPPPATVLAAGAGQVPLLRQLRLPRDSWRLEVFRTPLLVLPMTVMQGVRIFEDKVREFSVVSHPPSEGLPNGAMVIGTVRGSPTDFVPARERRIPKADCEKFWKIDCFGKYRGNGRFTAGFEVAVNGRRSVYPSVATFPNYPGLIAAIPGRATLSMKVARQVLDEIRIGRVNSTLPDIGADWTAQVFMHHESYYSHLNDVAQ